MFSLPRFLTRKGISKKSGGVGPVQVQPVTVADVETLTDRRSKALKHLIRVNHKTNALIYHELEFHNHTVHILGSAYFFGGSDDHLHEVYDAESKELEPWEDAPGEVGGPDWFTFRGKREYQRAFVDFFEDQLVNTDYNWQLLLKDFLFDKHYALIYGVTGGLGHSLIHLGYAYELHNREIAIEALAQIASNYDFDYEEHILQAPATPRTSKVEPTTSARDLIEAIRKDERLNGVFTVAGGDNVEKLSQDKKLHNIVWEYVEALQWTQAQSQFEDCFKLAALLLVATVTSKMDHYDFFLCHILTTMHAVRILLPIIPGNQQLTLLKQWWLLTVKVYIGQLRPIIKDELVEKVDLKGKGWNLVVEKALSGKYSLDAHYVKALRALKEGSEVFSDDEEWYLKAAVRLAEEFWGWGGFGDQTRT